MDYDLYKQIQAQLGVIPDVYFSQCTELISQSSVDKETKILLENLCSQTRHSLFDICLLISDTLKASSK